MVFTEPGINYQKTESLGLTDRYGYAYSPVLENGREGWANFTGDWNMAIAKNAQNKEACWEFIKWMATNQDIADWCWEGGKIPNNKEAIERLSAENIPLRMYSSIHWQLHPITSLFLQVSMMMHSLEAPMHSRQMDCLRCLQVI